METPTPRVWFKSISLENVRSFGTKQTIYFTDDGTDNGEATQWNIILGDNGTGKTTVLKGLVYCFGSTDLEKKYLVQFSRNDEIRSEFKYSTEIKHDGTLRNYISTAFIAAKNEFENANSELKIWAVTSAYDKNGVIFAYGASRRMGDTAIARETNGYVLNLFNENGSLVNAEEWLIQADYLRLKDEVYRKTFNAVYQIIEKLFRDEAPGGIKIDTSTGIPHVKLCTHYGPVRLHELSLGYKTLIAWMVDFAKGLLDRYPDSPDPLAEPAVCLVDEIDLHLHPKFQRTIIKFLTETFPNTQFIVTAHSPLIVQSAEDANIIVLKREGDETVVEADRINVHDWRIDQILSSDLFGGIGGRAPGVDEKMKRRRVLLRKDKLTDGEQAELAMLEKELGNLPVSESREALKALDIIGQALINQ